MVIDMEEARTDLDAKLADDSASRIGHLSYKLDVEMLNHCASATQGDGAKQSTLLLQAEPEFGEVAPSSFAQTVSYDRTFERQLEQNFRPEDSKLPKPVLDDIVAAVNRCCSEMASTATTAETTEPSMGPPKCPQAEHKELTLAWDKHVIALSKLEGDRDFESYRSVFKDMKAQIKSRVDAGKLPDSDTVVFLNQIHSECLACRIFMSRY